jgi:hypothetical protein
MDGRITEGRKGIAYLRDHYAPAVVEQAFARTPVPLPDRATDAAVEPAPA